MNSFFTPLFRYKGLWLLILFVCLPSLQMAFAQSSPIISDISGEIEVIEGAIEHYSIPVGIDDDDSNCIVVDIDWDVTGTGFSYSEASDKSSIEVIWATPGTYTISVDVDMDEVPFSNGCVYESAEASLVVNVLPLDGCESDYYPTLPLELTASSDNFCTLSFNLSLDQSQMQDFEAACGQGEIVGISYDIKKVNDDASEELILSKTVENPEISISGQNIFFSANESMPGSGNYYVEVEVIYSCAFCDAKFINETSSVVVID
ncbi:MAG: hypothetical protein AAFO69_11110, partial [Bacteroidota bacterium]